MPDSKFYIKFHAEGIGTVSVLRDSAAPLPTNGYGGWEAVDRARQRGLSVWRGVEPKQQDVPVLFDGVGNNKDQESNVMKLLKMASPDPHEPPVVTIDGKGFLDIAAKWVISGISFGGNTMWGTDSAGKDVLLRQDAVVSIMQYVADDRVAFSKAKPAQPGGRVWPKHYTVKKGDTLQKVAAKFYGSSKKWHLIANANNIRDPKHLKVGRVLIIPRPK